MTVAATATLATTGMAGADTPVRENNAAAHAVQVLNAAVTESNALPDDFVAVMGYEPERQGGRLVNPGGSCSSPVPLPAEFDDACKAHDLGYDVLRYATANDEELGPWARKELDARLEADMHSACNSRTGDLDRAGCYVMADVAAAAVTGNSWRQGYVTPTKESFLPYLLCGLGVVLSVATAVFVRRENGAVS
ncbi:MAG: hypothetical protein GX610_09760 [Rhodococcus sp.]|nr:hypothetical protein [Rhodococcus sp. (in: high G+C Gram-positive bacteria)]